METHELDLQGLKQWIPELITELEERQILLLSGGLGAGKTAFTRKLLQALGCEEANSPTYGLIHEYNVASLPACFHVDLYRLEDDEDLESSGFWELFANPKGLIIIEWADRLDESLYPLQWTKWAIEINKGRKQDTRHYTLRKI